MTKRKTKPKVSLPPILAAEREQVRIRRKHELPLAVDEHGRERIPTKTAEGRRLYDRSATGILRLRLTDPLVGVKGLSDRQRNAGQKYREAYEALAGAGIKPASVAERVDISGSPQGIPVSVLDNYRGLAAARASIGHHEIASVIEQVCGLRMSLREIAQRTRDPVPALAKLLKIGLDQLADGYFGRVKKK